MEQPELIGTSLCLVSSDPRWCEDARTLLKRLQVSVVGSMLPSSHSIPAAIYLVDGRGPIPRVPGRLVVALPPEVGAPLETASVRWPCDSDELQRVIEQETAAGDVPPNIAQFDLRARAVVQLVTDSVGSS